MSARSVWLDPAEWFRDGRGRSWVFQVPTGDLIAALDAVAGRLGDRFELLQCTRQRSGGEWLSLYTALPVHGLTLDGSWQYAVRSQLLTPSVPAPIPIKGLGWPALFAVNGLIMLDHPEPGPRVDPPRSSLSIVHRVQHNQTGEIREHRAYDHLFAAVKRAVQASQGSAARS